MKVRTSENPHEFQEKLFKRLNAYQLQGLLMDEQRNFTAAIEAVEYEKGDDINSLPFHQKELWARYILAEELRIPFYIVCYYKKIFHIKNVLKSADDKIEVKNEKDLNEIEFAEWWGKLKKTKQVKKLENGAEARTKETIFDRILRNYGLEWGGNIDGFVLSDEKHSVEYIIDNISVSSQLNSDWADPASYFLSSNPIHGPRFNGWLGAVKLAHILNVPHVLFTIDKNHPTEEHVGFTMIEKLSPKGIYYLDNVKPNKNILSRLDYIYNQVNNNVQRAHAPYIEGEVL